MTSAAIAPPAGVRRPLSSLPPISSLSLLNSLSLAPRLHLLLTFHRSDPAVLPIDEWKLRLALIAFLDESLSLPSPDLRIRKFPDLNKRKRSDPVAHGSLFIRNLDFLKVEDDQPAHSSKYVNWRSDVVNKLNGIELNLEGVGFKMEVEVPVADDFDRMKNAWEEWSDKRVAKRRPDTVVIEGIPSRWLAEPRVSSKPSMLVSHTVFSVLGSIRNLFVSGDDDVSKKSQDEGEIISGLHCKVWVQFENYTDFCNAMNVFCGRSMQKEGSNLKVDYEVTWDKDGFFQNVQPKTEKNHLQDRIGKMPSKEAYRRDEVPRYQSRVTRFDSDGARTKRFRD